MGHSRGGDPDHSIPIMIIENRGSKVFFFFSIILEPRVE
jgi:hypothetical protein